MDDELENPMAKLDPNSPEHVRTRQGLRTIGSILLGIGVCFTAVGFGSFFSSMGSFEPPRYFWCAFIGLPLVGIGSGLLKIGYFGAMARYVAREGSPVAGETFNYLSESIEPGVRTLTGAVAKGIAHGVDSEKQPCPACGHHVDESARFCDRCGQSLSRTRDCPSCGEECDSDSRFCAQCGTSLAG